MTARAHLTAPWTALSLSLSGRITDDDDDGDSARNLALSSLFLLRAFSVFTAYPVKGMHGEGGEETCTFIFFLTIVIFFLFQNPSFTFQELSSFLLEIWEMIGK